MKITKHELFNENTKDSNISDENIFGSTFDLKAGALSSQNRSSTDQKSKEPLGNGGKDCTRESVSSLRLSIGCHELKISARESEVYFQKISAGNVFSEDYKCKLRRRKCELDRQLTNIFGEKESKYSKLIREAKRRQRCGPCLSRQKCSCKDINRFPPTDLMLSTKPKTVESVKTIKPYLAESNKTKMEVGGVEESMKKSEFSQLQSGIKAMNNQGDENQAVDETFTKSFYNADESSRKKADLYRSRRDSELGTKRRLTDGLESCLEECASENNISGEGFSDLVCRKVKASGESPQVKCEAVPKTKSTSFYNRSQSKAKSCPPPCQTHYDPSSKDNLQNCRIQKSKKICSGCDVYTDNRRKSVRDVSSCIPTKGLKEASTSTKCGSAKITCKHTQTCCEPARRLTERKPCAQLRSVALDPVNQLELSDEAKVLVFLDDLIGEFEKQYEEATKRSIKKKKKRKCHCKTSDIYGKPKPRKQNYTYAYMAMTESYMQYEPLLQVKKSYSSENKNSRENDQNENLLQYLAFRRKQFSSCRYDFEKDLSLTEDDARRFDKKFCDFFQQNDTRLW